MAVVGVGHLGRHHARLYASLPQAQLVGVADLNLARAREVASAYGAQATADYRDLIGQVDAASIAVPTEAHFAVARDFIEQGRAVLVEKPFARSLAEADELIALAARQGVPIQVGHVERFNPAFLAAHKVLTTPVYIDCDRIGPFTFRSLDIGVVLDLMIHDLDILLDLVGAPVVAVQAVGVPVLSRHEDIANARLTFANGCVANLTASRVAAHAVRKVRIFQPDAYISLDYAARQAFLFRKRPDAPDPTQIDPRSIPDLKTFVFQNMISIETLPQETQDPLEQELRAFLDCVATGSKPLCSGADARRSLEVACRILDDIRANLSRQSAVGSQQ